MRIIQLVVIFTLFCTAVLAQNTGSVSGTVKTSDGSPAEFVNVSLKGTTKGTVADKSGHYKITNINPGTYTLVASFIGLQSQEQEITVAAADKLVKDFSLVENSSQLEEIVVSGIRDSYKADNASSSLRLSSSLLETPQNIQVVTGEVLKDQQIISMSDGLVRNVSGAVRSEHWGDMYTKISARGSQVQAFRNGFNVVNSYWGPLTEDMSFVDHVEFVKGPAGFMLSGGDPSGLYNVVTKKPTGVTKGEASLTMGSWGLFRTTLDLDGKLSKDGKLLYRLNLSAQNKNSFRPNEYNDRYVIAPVISYQVDDRTKLTFEYNYQRANMSNIGSFYAYSFDGFGKFPAEYSILPAGIPGTTINDNGFYANIQHDIDDNWKITGQIGYIRTIQVGSSMWPGRVFADNTMIRNIDIADAKSTLALGQVFVNGEVTTGSIRHRILAGIDIGHKEYYGDWGQTFELDSLNNRFDPNNPYLGIPQTGYPQFDRSAPIEQRAQLCFGFIGQQYSSAYIQDELGFLENRIRLTLAARYTDLKIASYSGPWIKADHITPRVGLSASINPQLSVYALYDQAFLPQSGVRTDGKKTEPITGNNMEVGVKKDWATGWNSTLSVYRILKNNELTGDPFNPTSGMSIELGQKRSQGVEFDVRGTIVKGLSLIANYAYTDSRVNKVSEGVTFPAKNSIVPGYAKHTFNAWLSYKIQTGALKGVGASVGYTALLDRATYWEAAPDPNKEMADYFKMDAGLFWEKDKIRFTVNVFNVLDKYLYSGTYNSWTNDKTTPVPNYTGIYSYQVEAPRNARFSVAYRF